MKHLKKFNYFKENVNNQNVTVKIEDKNTESFNFISKFFNFKKNHPYFFEDYTNNQNLYQSVARKGNKIIGVRIFKMENGRIHLYYTAVDDNERNKGINRKLLKEIETFGKKNNVNLITSNVRESNLASLNSLLKSGFQINKSINRFYLDGERKIALFKYLD